jgi:hypothetical protein
MSTVQEIESAIKRLNQAEMREIREWLDNMLEDELEFKEEFEARIKTSEQEMQQGKRRI